MRGALVAPLLLTTILVIAADNLDILDSNDDLDISKNSEDASAIYDSNIDDVMTKSVEDESLHLAGTRKRNMFMYPKTYTNVERNIEIRSVDEENPDPNDSQKRNTFFYATECYSCVGCNLVSGLADLKTCPYTTDISKQNRCIVYVEKFTNADEPWYIRGCASEHNTCAEMKQLYSLQNGLVSLVSCEECEGDRCNDGNRSHSPSFAAVAFFVIIAPLIAKYTLS